MHRTLIPKETHITERIYAISDIHGHLDQLHTALELVDLDGDSGANLVLLGDYIDRGSDSCGVLQLVQKYQQRHPVRVTALLGNHEVDFLDWLDGDDEDPSWLDGDINLRTVRSFVSAGVIDTIDSRSTGAEINAMIKRAILDRHTARIAWLRTLPRVHETPEQIFVHAGIDEEAGEIWRAATPDHVLTHKFPASMGPFVKTVVAGHVGTASLALDDSNGIFYDAASHYYIDGSVETTGKLNVLRYELGTQEYFFHDQI